MSVVSTQLGKVVLDSANDTITVEEEFDGGFTIRSLDCGKLYLTTEMATAVISAILAFLEIATV